MTRDLAALTLVLVLLFGTLLGVRPLGNPDEGRYSDVSNAMVASGDYMTPRVNGVQYLYKPPLFHWLQAATIRAFGTEMWVYRLVPMLAGIAACLALYAAGRALWGRAEGLAAAAIQATALLPYVGTRLVSLDFTLAAFVTLALLAVLVAVEHAEGRTRRWLFYAAYAAAGAATMTKGLVGLVLPGFTVMLWIALTGRWRLLREAHLPEGILIILAVAGPWHLYMSLTNPNFVPFYFVREHFLRFLTKIHHRYEPAWFFLPVMVAGLLPWTLFLPAALAPIGRWWRARRQRPAIELFLVCWAVAVVGFFSASSSKLIPYVLPAFPALALLMAPWLVRVWRGEIARGFAWGTGLLALVALGALAFLLWVEHGGGAAAGAALARLAERLGRIGAPVDLVAALLFLGPAIAWWMIGRGPPRLAVAALVAAWVPILWSANIVALRVDERSTYQLAQAIGRDLAPDDEVAIYHGYAHDLPVYLGRRITVAGYEGELEHSLKWDDTSGWMIGDAEFWRRWAGPRRLIVVVGRDALSGFMTDAAAHAATIAPRILAEGPRRVVVVNRP